MQWRVGLKPELNPQKDLRTATRLLTLRPILILITARMPVVLRYQTNAAGKRIRGTAMTNARIKYHSIFLPSYSNINIGGQPIKCLTINAYTKDEIRCPKCSSQIPW